MMRLGLTFALFLFLLSQGGVEVASVKLKSDAAVTGLAALREDDGPGAAYTVFGNAVQEAAGSQAGGSLYPAHSDAQRTAMQAKMKAYLDKKRLW